MKPDSSGSSRARSFRLLRRALDVARPLVAGAVLATFACTPGPQPIPYGEAGCETCLMGIFDERWGAEIVTRTGRVHIFDSVECMAAYVIHSPDPDRIHSLWVTDFADPPTLVAVEDAFFLRSDNLTSPMGLGLTAFGESSIRHRAVEDSFGGDLLGWTEVLEYVEAHWPEHGRHERPRSTREVSPADPRAVEGTP